MTDIQIISVQLSEFIKMLLLKCLKIKTKAWKNYAMIGLEREKQCCDKSMDTFFYEG